MVLLFFLFSSFLLISYKSVTRQEIERWDEYTNINVVSESNFSDLKYEGRNFFEKPPLWYWLTQISVKILGENVIGFRFISTLSFFGIFTLIFLLIRKKYGFYIAIFASIFILSIQQIVQPRFDFIFSTHSFFSADLDSLLIFFCLLSFIFCIKHYETNKLRYLFLIGIFSGLAILTKGLLGLLPVISYFIFRRKSLKDSAIILITALLVAAPWHLYEYIKYGKEFIDVYFLYHNIDRGITATESHTGDALFYFSTILNLQVFPGILVLFLSCSQIKEKEFKNNYLARLCLINILLCFLIITIVQTKLSWYILYIYPFCAIFFASGVRFLSMKKPDFALRATPG